MLGLTGVMCSSLLGGFSANTQPCRLRFRGSLGSTVSPIVTPWLETMIPAGVSVAHRRPLSSPPTLLCPHLLFIAPYHPPPHLLLEHELMLDNDNQKRIVLFLGVHTVTENTYGLNSLMEWKCKGWQSVRCQWNQFSSVIKITSR